MLMGRRRGATLSARARMMEMESNIAVSRCSKTSSPRGQYQVTQVTITEVGSFSSQPPKASYLVEPITRCTMLAATNTGPTTRTTTFVTQSTLIITCNITLKTLIQNRIIQLCKVATKGLSHWPVVKIHQHPCLAKLITTSIFLTS